MKFEVVGGEKFIEIREAAKLAGIHPAIIEMGQRLLKKPGEEGGVFQLTTSELQARGESIEQTFKAGLRKVAKAMGPGGLAVRSLREDLRITFWYRQGAKKRAA